MRVINSIRHAAPKRKRKWSSDSSGVKEVEPRLSRFASSMSLVRSRLLSISSISRINRTYSTMSAEQLSPEELRSNYDGIQQLVDAAAAERAEGPKVRSGYGAQALVLLTQSCLLGSLVWSPSRSSSPRLTSGRCTSMA